MFHPGILWSPRWFIFKSHTWRFIPWALKYYGFDRSICGFTSLKHLLCFPYLTPRFTSPSVPPLPFGTPGNHWSFNYHCDPAVADGHIIVITKYLAFLRWLLSLIWKYLRSLHMVLLWLNSFFFFFFFAKQSSIVQMDHSFIIHSPMENIFVASSFRHLWIMLPCMLAHRYLCAVSLQIRWVNTEEWDCWIIQWDDR